MRRPRPTPAHLGLLRPEPLLLPHRRALPTARHAEEVRAVTMRCPAPSCQVDVQRSPHGTLAQGLEDHYQIVHPDRDKIADLSAHHAAQVPTFSDWPGCPGVDHGQEP